MHAHSHETLATGPVCGMKVAAGGPLSENHRGTTYWFCDPACAATFREDPERWASGETMSHDHGEQHGAHRA